MTNVNLFLYLGISFILGSFIALVTRAWHLLNNPRKIKKNKDGKICWWFEIIYGFVGSLIGGIVAVVGFLVAGHLGITDQLIQVAIAGSFATAGGEIWLLLQKKIMKFVHKVDNQTDIKIKR